MEKDSLQLFLMTQEEIDTYLQEKSNQGVLPVTVAKYKAPLMKLLLWLEDDQLLTAEKLRAWRKVLEEQGYSKVTIQRNVTVVNDFLRARNHSELCIPRPIQKDLTGMTFGYLTVLEATEKRRRRDVVWRCRCKCGKETEVPTVMLLGGNTTSCGCLNIEVLKHVNHYVEGTSLRQALMDNPISTHASSGYTGVQAKRDKWAAYINYKGVRYHLGVYTQLEDAVKARARAKQLVMEDAARLYKEYADGFGEVPKADRRRQ